MSVRYLTALPVFNEEKHINGVLDEVLRHADDVLVIDDGSTDGTARLLAARDDIRCVTHTQNRGYGAALRTAFELAIRAEYDVLVTIDCDGQHEPQRIAQFVAACSNVDVVSGSRYLTRFPGDSMPPADRQTINREITRLLNGRLGLKLTDGFCGFKAYRVAALTRLTLTETGYAMPIEFWVQAAHHGLRIVELAIPLIYLDEERGFGGALDDARHRLEHYQQVLGQAMAAVAVADPCPWCGDELCLTEHSSNR